MKTQKYHRRLIFTEFSGLLDTYDTYKEQEFENKHQDLLDHIGELSMEIYKCHNEINELFELNEEKARRINKAIEYIHKQTTDEDTGKNLGYSDNIDDEYLIDILKGRDNND